MTATRALVFGIAALMLHYSDATANDTTASFAIGGLVPLQQADIAMESETLRITAAKIDVSYRFRNHADRDIDAIVAFPLPRFNHRFFFFENAPWSNGTSGNLVDFSLTVDGAPVDSASDTRAFLMDKDITDRLRGLGVPLGVGITPHYAPAIDSALIAEGLMESVDMGKPVHIPLWDEQTTFYWRQRFPAAATVRIDHAYNPAAGYEHMNDVDHPLADLCLSAADIAEFRRLADLDRKRHPWANGYIADLAIVDYILTTANNWDGPIGDFTLTITPERERTMAGACYPGLERTGPETLTLHAANFSPPAELRVYFVELQPER